MSMYIILERNSEIVAVLTGEKHTRQAVDLYMKAGVMLTDFYDAGVYQPDLFCGTHVRAKLMKVIDKINHSGKERYGFMA